MIKVEKNFLNIPSVLQKENREEAFDNNVSLSRYADSKNRYKVGSVQSRLNKIYYLKCAYCEQKLLDAPKHIEHYRPKNIYYWLAYSWDNLLLSCGGCNSSKSDSFKTQNQIVSYDNESFKDIHNLSSSYDTIEKPFIINPEKDDILELIQYRKNGEVFSENERVKYTIQSACKLNREELVQKRLPILIDFINKINKHYEQFSIKGDITRFYPDVETFMIKVSKKSEFYSFRYYIFHNLDLFFENENIQKLLKIAVSKVGR
jgi:uncharacterized protein (TIGR02646 family)